MDLRTLELTISRTAVRWEYSSSRENDLDARSKIDSGEHELAIVGRATIIEHLIQIRDLLSATRGAFHQDVRENVDDVLQRTGTLLGEHLYEALLERAGSDLIGSLETAFEEAVGGKYAFCLELAFADKSDTIASWPWEFLYSRPQRNYIALMDNVAVTRANSAKLDKHDFSVPRNEIEVLLVLSRPRSLPDVDGSSVEEMLGELGLASAKGSLIEPPYPRDEDLPHDYSPVASWSNFERAVISRDPHIIHFIGHGQRSETGKLAFVDDDGDANWVSLNKLTQLVRGCKRLRLLLLQACELARPETQSLLSSLERQMAKREMPPTVIAMQGTVTNEDADAFACAFYRVLADAELPGTIAEAVSSGRGAMGQATLGFGIPVVALWSYRPLLGALRSQQDSAKQGLRCPACGKKVDEHDRFCGACSHMLLHDCGARLPHPVGNFCTQCGKPLEGRAELGTPPRPPALRGIAPVAADPPSPSHAEPMARKPWGIRQ